MSPQEITDQIVLVPWIKMEIKFTNTLHIHQKSHNPVERLPKSIKLA
jgi:hypothetical protein